MVGCIKEAVDFSREHGFIEELKPGEWHTPYVTHYRDVSGVLYYLDNNGNNLSVQQAKEASTARCARSSYDKHDGTVTTWDADVTLYKTLVADDPKHMSPCEHQATPMQNGELEGFGFREDFPGNWEEGVTHTDRTGKLWSGNFCGWIQNRQLIPNHVKKG